MEFTFNTNRQYSADGQPITARVTDDRIYFTDHARMIAGSFEHAYPITSEAAAKRAVMRAYDHNQYRQEF